MSHSYKSFEQQVSEQLAKMDSARAKRLQRKKSKKPLSSTERARLLLKGSNRNPPRAS